MLICLNAPSLHARYSVMIKIEHYSLHVVGFYKLNSMCGFFSFICIMETTKENVKLTRLGFGTRFYVQLNSARKGGAKGSTS